MAGTRTKKQPAVDEGADPTLPEWKQQSIERSLQAARGRAKERTDRFVASTLQLMQEQGGTEFTVQDVVDRSHMSIRTFYNFFASKDDLLVAVYETILVEEVLPRLRKRCDAKRDPIDRVRAYIDAMYDLTADAGPIYRALTTYRNRLAETRPDDLERAFRPQVMLVEELLQGAVDAGRLKSDLSTETLAKLLHQMVLAEINARILGSQEALSVTADELWHFCACGIGLRPADIKRR
jgi:AcrR family transcriptional regulator